jgi:hypothetical protein
VMQQQEQPNRALRRQQQRMQAKSRQPRRRPLINANAHNTAILQATRLTAKERADLLQPARDGFKALREGVATHLQWVAVNTLIAIAMAIEEQGVIRGMHEHFTAADRAIDAVWSRVQNAEGGPSWGRRTTLYFDEISALSEAIHLHEEQLKVLATSELYAATALAMKRTRAIGGQVVRTAAEVEQIQECLI